jgi:rare lipoprotein A
MANGVPFNPDELTAASWFFPFGTQIQVLHENRSVIVTITDRGPAMRLVRQGRIIDLSEAAFRQLADPRNGLIYVRLYRLPTDS